MGGGSWRSFSQVIPEHAIEDNIGPMRPIGHMYCDWQFPRPAIIFSDSETFIGHARNQTCHSLEWIREK